jgi:hypothetical protein
MLVLVEEGESGLATRRVGLWGRLVAGVHSAQLDGALAAGASPDADVRLALRAQRLVGMSFRRDLAHSLRRIVDMATGRVATKRRSVPLCRDRVTEAYQELEALTQRLLTPGPVAVRGVAQVSTLLGDARGPLYHRGNTDDLRSRVSHTVQALDPLRDEPER